MTWRDEDERYDFVREGSSGRRALDEAATRGRAIRRTTPVTFLPSAARAPRWRRALKVAARYAPVAGWTLAIGIGLLMAAYALVALP